MTYVVKSHGSQVHVDGASAEDVKAGLALLEAARELQYQEAVATRNELVHVITRAHIDLVPPASLEQARRLGEFRVALQAAGVFTYDTLSQLRGDSRTSSTRTWVARQREARRLFTVTEQGRALIPAFQLDEAGAPRVDLAPLLATLLDAGVDGWELWSWLASPTPLLSGGVPEQVATQNPDRALRAAQQFVARR